MLGLAVGLALPLRHSESVYNHNRNKSNYYSGYPCGSRCILAAVRPVSMQQQMQ